jgi:hypothetical protein
LQEAQEAAQEAANAEAAARERWAREEAEAKDRVGETILAKARKLREESISAAKSEDFGTAVSKMEASLALTESKSSRELLKKYQTERDRRARESAAALSQARARAEAERKSEEARRQAQTSERTSSAGTGTTSTAQTQASGPPPGMSWLAPTATNLDASGDWFGKYEAGTFKTLKINGIDYRFHYCPAGTFTRGARRAKAVAFPTKRNAVSS